MRRFILAFVLIYNCLAVNASFFTWVANTLNPVFDKVFPEAYHPTVRNRLPVYPRTQSEASEEPEEPPTFYIDQNNTIRGLLRRHEDNSDSHIVIENPPTEKVTKPKKCGIKCMRKKMRELEEQTRELLEEQTSEQIQNETGEYMGKETGEFKETETSKQMQKEIGKISQSAKTKSNQSRAYTVEITWDPTGNEKSELTIHKHSGLESELSDESTNDEMSEKELLHERIVGSKSRSTRLPRTTVANETEANISSCDVCRDTREKYLFTPDRIRCHGYRSEKYTTLTIDGYLLTIFRVLPSQDTKVPREQVLLNHGLLGSSDDWLLIGKNKSLVYKLVDAGYDVWLGNTRGNSYSNGHLGQCTKQKPCYWQFSWQEIGEYDVRAMIDLIVLVVQKETGQLNVTLNYIGHSMGATALIVLLSTNPHYNAHIRMAVLLAPLVFMSHKMHHLQDIVKFADNHPNDVQDSLGNGVGLPSWWLDELEFDDRCVLERDAMCTNALFFIAGPVLKPWDACLRADVLRSVPAGGSLNTLRHYAQNTRNDAFQQHYGGEFQLSEISAPIALFCSKNDTLALEASVHKLYLRLRNTITYQVLSSLSHTEFVWGMEADHIVYHKVLGILKSGLGLVDYNNDVEQVEHRESIKDTEVGQGENRKTLNDTEILKEGFHWENSK